MFSKFSPVLLMVLLLLVSAETSAQQWTLEASVRQAMANAPELKKSMAEIGAREAEGTLSGMWPDPSVEFRVDNKLGLDDGSGGYDLTDITISQPIPLSRIKYQQSVADANLQSARFTYEYESLQLQNRVSKVFHELQYASAQLALTEKRLEIAEELSKQPKKNSQGVIVRYLTSLEKLRLSIVREEAHQAAHNAEGKYHEALNEFAKLLSIEPDGISGVTELHSIDAMPNIKHLFELQDNHAQLSSQQQQLLAATHEIDVARSTQTSDPTISLSQSKDTFGNGQDNVYGIMFNIQIPLHDRKDTAVSKARYKANQENIELQRLKRELQINLKRSFTHLNHVVEQAAAYEEKVLKPAKKMLDLSKKGFASGELNVLSLVDANNTYFEARLRYLELLYQAWAELADVKLFAGQLLTDADAGVNLNARGK